MFVQCSGKGAPLVLLHGWSMNVSVWQPVLAELEKKYTVYRVDLPGHGCSRVPAPDSCEQWLDGILEVVPDESVWLGWSLGGTLALSVAAHYPQRVKRLVLVAATAKFVAAEDWPDAVEQEVWSRFVGLFEQDPVLANKQFMQLQSLGVIGPRKLGSALLDMQTNGGAPSAQGLIKGLELLGATDLRPALSGLECPIHLMLGEHDKLIPASAGAAMQALNTNVVVDVIAQAGHVPFVSHPKEFIAVLG